MASGGFLGQLATSVFAVGLAATGNAEAAQAMANSAITMPTQRAEGDADEDDWLSDDDQPVAHPDGRMAAGQNDAGTGTTAGAIAPAGGPTSLRPSSPAEVGRYGGRLGQGLGQRIAAARPATGACASDLGYLEGALPHYRNDPEFEEMRREAVATRIEDIMQRGSGKPLDELIALAVQQAEASEKAAQQGVEGAIYYSSDAEALMQSLEDGTFSNNGGMVGSFGEAAIMNFLVAVSVREVAVALACRMVTTASVDP
jgi:hypothetical protein